MGCGVFSYEYFNFDGIGPSTRTHRRWLQALESLTGSPGFTYQGMEIWPPSVLRDGAVQSRGELISIIFINNTLYGMTGGQMAPTTMMGQVTATTPRGKRPGAGHPFRVCEMLATAGRAAYVARTAVYSPAQVVRTKRPFAAL